MARVVEATRNSNNLETAWELTLHLEETDSGILSEFNFNNLSVDQIAEMRARFILLNEPPVEHNPGNLHRPSNLNDSLLLGVLQGRRSGVVIEKSILPDLWKSHNRNIELFLPLARLWSVFHLITTNTCEHILELTLGLVSSNKLRVKFRGLRRKQYVNQSPVIIEFEGYCNLDS